VLMGALLSSARKAAGAAVNNVPVAGRGRHAAHARASIAIFVPSMGSMRQVLSIEGEGQQHGRNRIAGDDDSSEDDMPLLQRRANA